jgi:hypothetical protein
MISIIISIIVSVYIAGILGEIFGSISSNSSYSSLSINQNIGGIGILGIIPNLLFLYAFYIPYTRIKNGEEEKSFGDEFLAGAKRLLL